MLFPLEIWRANMRFPSALIAILLCSASLAACASFGPSAPAKTASTGTSDDAAALASRAPVMDLETGVKQAQSQRLAGRYDDAIRTLSQLMLVASDDPRVIGEYGKTLAEKGRAQDAVQFLTRATELQPGDWSVYSALGVAYDELGNQASAQIAYERALKLKPEDPSILNNYALSRMLANDPDVARQLIGRAQAAGGASDPKIARNIEMMTKLAADAPPEQKAAAAQAPSVPSALPVAVSSSALPPAAPANKPVASQQPDATVVMQAVPADPLAGPAKRAAHEPTPLAKPMTAAAKPAAAPKASEGPAIAKAVRPGAVKSVATKAAAKDANAKPPLDLRRASAKSVKAADLKPSAQTGAKPAPKNGIPALRQTASTY